MSRGGACELLTLPSGRHLAPFNGPVPRDRSRASNGAPLPLANRGCVVAASAFIITDARPLVRDNSRILEMCRIACGKDSEG